MSEIVYYSLLSAAVILAVLCIVQTARVRSLGKKVGEMKSKVMKERLSGLGEFAQKLKDANFTGSLNKDKTIVYVDDNCIMTSLTKSTFSNIYNLIPVDSVEALEGAIRGSGCDLVICNCINENSDFLKYISCTLSAGGERAVPVLLVSDVLQYRRQVMALEEGAMACMTIPFNPDYARALAGRLIGSSNRKQKCFKEDRSPEAPVPNKPKAVKNSSAAKSSPRANPLYKAAEKAISANLAFSDLSPEKLSELLGVSPSALGRAVKESSGMTVSELIRSRRLTQSARLLEKTDLPIEEIITRCGYANRGNFFRRFSEEYNMTPKAFRDSKRLQKQL